MQEALRNAAAEEEAAAPGPRESCRRPRARRATAPHTPTPPAARPCRGSHRLPVWSGGAHCASPAGDTGPVSLLFSVFNVRGHHDVA